MTKFTYKYNKIYVLFLQKLTTEGETRERERERRERERAGVYNYAKRATVGESRDADFAVTVASNIMTTVANSPVKLAIFSQNPKQIATKVFFCIFVKNKYSYMTY